MALFTVTVRFRTQNEPVRKTGFENRSASHTFREPGRNLEGAFRMATQGLPEPCQERGSLPRDTAPLPSTAALSPPPSPRPGGHGLCPDVPSLSHVCPHHTCLPFSSWWSVQGSSPAPSSSPSSRGARHWFLLICSMSDIFMVF